MSTGVQQNAALWAAMAVALNAATLLAAALPLGAGAELLAGGASGGGSLAGAAGLTVPLLLGSCLYSQLSDLLQSPLFQNLQSVLL